MPSPTLASLRSGDVGALTAAINASPTWRTLGTIVGEFRTLSEAHPTQTLQFAETIHAASQPPACTATMRDDDDPDNAADLMNELDVTVLEMLSGVFCVNDRVPGYADITPTNPLLAAALMSGACMRIGLCRSADQMGMVCAGLQFPEYLHGNSAAESELYALHACLALLVGGAEMYKELECDHDKFPAAFKKLVDEDVIKDENGKKLLQVCGAGDELIHILIYDCSSSSRSSRWNPRSANLWISKRSGKFSFLRRRH